MSCPAIYGAYKPAILLWEELKKDDRILPLEKVWYNLWILSMGNITDTLGAFTFPAEKGAAVTRMLAENIPVYIDRSELFASGTIILEKCYEDLMRQKDDKLFEENRHLWDICNGNSSHSAVDYAKLIKVGINGVMEEAKEKLKNASDDEEKAFYSSMLGCLESVLIYADRLKNEAKRLLEKETDGRRIKELERMAGTLKNVPRKPASSFYEAVQSILVYHVFLKMAEKQNNSLGRIDYILNDIYISDIEAGKITQKEAAHYIQMLLINSSCITPYADSITIAGQTEDGEVFYNDLTYFCLDAIYEIRNQNPQVGFRYLPGHPDSLLKRAFRPVLSGVANPSVFGDDTAVAALIRAGFEARDARNFVNCQCVELSPQGKSNIISGAFYWDLSIPLKILMGIQPEDGYTVKDFSDFDGLCDEYFNILKLKLKELVDEIKRWQQSNINTQVIPLISSALIDGTIEKARPALTGGAKYNFTFPTFIGAATVVDSLCAVRQCVYEDKKLSVNQLANECIDNFSSNEQLRLYLLNKCPKFGNNDMPSNSLMKRITEYIYSELSQYRNLYGEAIGPCYFGFVLHGDEEKTKYATPDGRRIGDAVSCTFGSDMGRDENGPTSMLKSAACFDHTLAIGGLAANFTINRDAFSKEDDEEKLISLVKTYIGLGGMQLQFNFLSKADLLDAQIHPEKHKDLLVRIAGFTGRFIEYNSSIQNQIIARVK